MAVKRPEKKRNNKKNRKSRVTISRRKFIKDLSVGAAGVAMTTAFPSLALSEAKKVKALSKVVIARHPNSVIDAYTFDQSIVGELVQRAITEFTGQEAPGLAWAQIFPGLTASSVISIKVNCINRYCSSHPVVAYAIAEGLASIQVEGGNFPRNNVIIWDRTNGEVQNAGYTKYTGSDPDTVRCFGTNESGYGYDSGSALDVNGVTCNPSRILTQHCNYLINLAVLKNHGGPGVTLGIKNHLGSIHNPGSLPHGDMDPELPYLNQEIKDVLGNKHRISIIDSLVGIRSGGPSGAPQFTYGGIILGTDLVATDYVGRDVLADNGCTTTGNAGYIDTAGSAPYDLGTANPAEMDVVEHSPIPQASREHVDKMIRFHKEGLATALQVEWAVNRYARGM
jgi:uncharacterized protein (DUF362 family)